MTLPALTLDGFELPLATADDVSTGRLDIPVQRSEPFSIPEDPIDLGIISVQLQLEISVRTQAARMTLTGVRTDARADAIELRDVTLPYGATDLTLADLGLETLEIPTIGVS